MKKNHLEKVFAAVCGAFSRHCTTISLCAVFGTVQGQTPSFDLTLSDGRSIRDAVFLGVDAQHAEFMTGNNGFRVPVALLSEEGKRRIKMSYEPLEGPYTSPPIRPSALTAGGVVVDGFDPIEASQAQFHNALLKNARIPAKNATATLNDTIPATALYGIRIDAHHLGKDWKRLWFTSKNNLGAFLLIETTTSGQFILQVPQAISVSAPSMVAWLGPMLPPDERVVIKCFKQVFGSQSISASQ